MKDLVSVNGVITAPEEAKISVYDRGFLFGDAIYEVTRSYGKVLFALEPHVDRLYRSAENIQLKLPFTKEEMQKEIYRVCNATEQENVYVRIQISRGFCKFGPINLNPVNTTTANVVMYVHPMPAYGNEIYEKGVHLVSSRYLRNTKEALDPNIKSGNYLNNILAYQDALAAGAYDAIMLNEDGQVTEGTTFNIFMVKQGSIVSCPDDFDILHGITRQYIFDIAKRDGLKIEKRPFTLSELQNAGEVFMSSSTKEIVPVTKLNQSLISGGRVGPVTQDLALRYKKLVQDYCKSHSNSHSQLTGA